jgi:hypothetical protein
MEPKTTERRIREIAHRLWEDSGRPNGQADRHWEQARQIVDAQNRTIVTQPPRASLQFTSESPRETSMRSFEEIVAAAQKAVALSLQEAFDAGKAHTASELKRRMAAVFEGLISGDAEARAEPAHAPSSHETQHTDRGHDQ